MEYYSEIECFSVNDNLTGGSQGLERQVLRDIPDCEKSDEVGYCFDYRNQNLIKENTTHDKTAYHLYDDTFGCNENAFVQNIKSLLKMYSLRVDELKQEAPVSSGGLQQYINKQPMEVNEDTLFVQSRKGKGSETTTIFDLPDSVQLHLFSFLDAKSLCQVSCTCQHWSVIAWDDLLWQERLDFDVKTWSVIGHTTNPPMYKECKSDWTVKDIYLRCSPEVNKVARKQNMNFHNLSSMLRSFWPKKIPKIVMFGPGLESNTSGLVRNILQDKSGLFTATGMFPGQFDGVGSGFTMRMRNNLSFHLITLYTTTKLEREQLRPEQRLDMRLNKLMAPIEGQDPEAQEEQSFELRDSIKGLCKTLDAFVFVVDATKNSKIRGGKAELKALVNEMWSSPDVPVVVLSCVCDMGVERIPCSQIAHELELHTLNRPWQVYNCVIDTRTGLEPALEWVIEQAQRR